jgi:hypothetical protein
MSGHTKIDEVGTPMDDQALDDLWQDRGAVVRE